MGARSILHELGALVAPPLCAVCAAPCAIGGVLCRACGQALGQASHGSRILPGVGEVVWVAPHDGVPRRLVRALKFGGRIALAGVAAERIAAILPSDWDPAGVVAVPPERTRLRRRGFDPTGLLAADLAALLALPLAGCLERLDKGRQVGRRRAARVADPPRVRCRPPVPGSVLLVDDVLTTGATLRACAAALTRGGSSVCGAAVFAAAAGGRGEGGVALV